MKPDKAVAVVTLRNPSNWTARGRKDIAAWLRRVASEVDSHITYSPLSRYRYMASGQRVKRVSK